MSRILYGCIVVLTVLAALGEDPVHPLKDMAMVWIALAGVALAEAWSEIVVKEAGVGHPAYWPEVAAALRHSAWVLPAGIVSTVTFLMSSTRRIGGTLAYDLATWALVIFVFVSTAGARWLAGAGLRRSLAVGIIASALGFGIAQLRAFVH